MRAVLLALLLLSTCPLVASGAEPSEDLAGLIAKLGSESYQEREEATRQLRLAGDRARKLLEKACSSEDAEIRERARVLLREILWRLSPELAAKLGELAAQFESYPDSDPGLRLQLLSQLQARASREAERYILQAIAEAEEPDSKAYLASLLRSYRSADAETAVLLLSREEDRRCRDRAADAMGHSDSPETAARLVELAIDEDPVVRAAALASLARRTEPTDAVHAVVTKGLSDRDAQVRSAACSAAGAPGNRKLGEKVWEVASGDADANVRCAAISAFGQTAEYNDTAVAERLAGLLNDPMPAVRMSALSALVDMRSASQSARLATLLEDDDCDIAAAAASGLAALDARRFVPNLRKALHAGKSTSLTCAAATALAAMRDQESIPAIAGLLDSDNAPVANAAASALAMTGDIKWAAELARAARKRDAESFSVESLDMRLAMLRDRSALEPMAQAMRSAAQSYRLSGLLARLALYDQAARLMRHEASTRQNYPFLLGVWGGFEVQAGSEDSGLQLLKQSTDMDRNSSMGLNNAAWFMLTCCDTAHRDLPEATRLAKRAANMEPRSACILDTLAWALFLDGHAEEALATADRALQWSDPTEYSLGSTIAAHRAIILAGLGRRDEAMKVLDNSTRRWPRDPELALECARAYCALDLPARAIAELNRMLDLLYPDVHVLKNDPSLAAARRLPEYEGVLARAEKLRGEMLKLLQPAVDEVLARPVHEGMIFLGPELE